jgi:hypothetical protein
MKLDSITIGIIVLLFAVFFLDKKDSFKKVENFSDSSSVEKPQGYSSVNLNGTAKFGNFGKFGEIPAMPMPKACQLNFGCVNAPSYNVSEKEMNVCRECIPDLMTLNRTDPSRPILVAARAAGLPRQTRMILG